VAFVDINQGFYFILFICSLFNGDGSTSAQTALNYDMIKINWKGCGRVLYLCNLTL
jgi:hypothetical protein